MGARLRLASGRFSRLALRFRRVPSDSEKLATDQGTGVAGGRWSGMEALPSRCRLWAVGTSTHHADNQAAVACLAVGSCTIPGIVLRIIEAVGLRRQGLQQRWVAVRNIEMRAVLKTVQGLIVATTWFVGPHAEAADANHGSDLAKRWCAACHVVDSSQTQASADVPTFATMARGRTSRRKRWPSSCWTLTRRCQAFR